MRGLSAIPAVLCTAAVLTAAGCSGPAAPAASAPGSTAPSSGSPTSPAPVSASTPTPTATRPSPTPTVPPSTRFKDPSGQLVRSVNRYATGRAPKQVAFTPDGKELWVTLLGGDGVAVHNAVSGAKLAGIRLGRHGGAVEVIFTRDGTTAYVSQMETHTVWQVDVATRRVRRSVDVKGAWTKVLSLSPDERTLYAANWISHDVSVIDLPSWRVQKVIPTVHTPRGLYPSPDGRSLYVAGYDNGELARIDLRSGKQKLLLRTGGAMRHLVGDGRRLYASDMGTASVYVVDLASAKVRRLARVDDHPNTIDLSPDGRVLYVSCRGRNNPKSYYIPGPEWGSVVVLDARTGRPLDAIVAGNQTTGLDVSDDGGLLAISDFLDNRIRLYTVPPYEGLAGGNGGFWSGHRAVLTK
ncbi:YncE family protein [Kribbella turkmenica]|uniref:YncE family protein n=1 Tax=Kribbella turkmenica TaxID=2530375 RepID=A0A4R4XEY9_9ACTN|nr:YncE family protein [Kribbella turkmenica]TDD29316.1 YncE family protein [Kribbella turkmenica]